MKRLSYTTLISLLVVTFAWSQSLYQDALNLAEILRQEQRIQNGARQEQLPRLVVFQEKRGVYCGYNQYVPLTALPQRVAQMTAKRNDSNGQDEIRGNQKMLDQLGYYTLYGFDHTDTLHIQLGEQLSFECYSDPYTTYILRTTPDTTQLFQTAYDSLLTIHNTYGSMTLYNSKRESLLTLEQQDEDWKVKAFKRNIRLNSSTTLTLPSNEVVRTKSYTKPVDRETRLSPADNTITTGEQTLAEPINFINSELILEDGFTYTLSGTQWADYLSYLIQGKEYLTPKNQPIIAALALNLRYEAANRKIVVSQIEEGYGYTKNFPYTLTKNEKWQDTIHTVAKGETLYGIADLYGMTTDDLITKNNLLGYTINVGQQFKVSQKQPMVAKLHGFYHYTTDDWDGTNTELFSKGGPISVTMLDTLKKSDRFEPIDEENIKINYNTALPIFAQQLVALSFDSMTSDGDILMLNRPRNVYIPEDFYQINYNKNIKTPYKRNQAILVDTAQLSTDAATMDSTQLVDTMAVDLPLTETETIETRAAYAPIEAAARQQNYVAFLLENRHGEIYFITSHSRYNYDNIDTTYRYITIYNDDYIYYNSAFEEVPSMYRTRNTRNIASILATHHNLTFDRLNEKDILQKTWSAYQSNYVLSAPLSRYLQQEDREQINPEFSSKDPFLTTNLINQLKSDYDKYYAWQKVLYGNANFELRKTTSYQEILNDYNKKRVVAAQNLKQTTSALNSREKKNTGFNQAAIIEGLSDFIVDRAQEELNITFMNRMREKIEKDIPEFRVLFPDTYNTFTNLQLRQYRTLLSYSRSSFQSDLNNLGLNFPRLFDLPKYKILADDPAVYNISLVYDLANKVYDNTPVDSVLLHLYTRLDDRLLNLDKRVLNRLSGELVKSRSRQQLQNRQRKGALNTLIRKNKALFDQINHFDALMELGIQSIRYRFELDHFNSTSEDDYALKTVIYEGREKLLYDIPTQYQYDLDNKISNDPELDYQFPYYNAFKKVKLETLSSQDVIASDAEKKAARLGSETIEATRYGVEKIKPSFLSISRGNEKNRWLYDLYNPNDPRSQYKEFEMQTQYALQSQINYDYEFQRLKLADYDSYFEEVPADSVLVGKGLTLMRSFLESDQLAIRQEWMNFMEQEVAVMIKELKAQKNNSQAQKVAYSTDVIRYFHLIHKRDTIVNLLKYRIRNLESKATVSLMVREAIEELELEKEYTDFERQILNDLKSNSANKDILKDSINQRLEAILTKIDRVYTEGVKDKIASERRQIASSSDTPQEDIRILGSNLEENRIALRTAIAKQYEGLIARLSLQNGKSSKMNAKRRKISSKLSKKFLDLESYVVNVERKRMAESTKNTNAVTGKPKSPKNPKGIKRQKAKAERINRKESKKIAKANLEGRIVALKEQLENLKEKKQSGSEEERISMDNQMEALRNEIETLTQQKRSPQSDKNAVKAKPNPTKTAVDITNFVELQQQHLMVILDKKFDRLNKFNKTTNATSIIPKDTLESWRQDLADILGNSFADLKSDINVIESSSQEEQLLTFRLAEEKIKFLKVLDRQVKKAERKLENWKTTQKASSRQLEKIAAYENEVALYLDRRFDRVADQVKRGKGDLNVLLPIIQDKQAESQQLLNRNFDLLQAKAEQKVELVRVQKRYQHAAQSLKYIVTKIEEIPVISRMSQYDDNYINNKKEGALEQKWRDEIAVTKAQYDTLFSKAVTVLNRIDSRFNISKTDNMHTFLVPTQAQIDQWMELLSSNTNTFHPNYYSSYSVLDTLNQARCTSLAWDDQFIRDTLQNYEVIIDSISRASVSSDIHWTIWEKGYGAQPFQVEAFESARKELLQWYEDKKKVVAQFVDPAVKLELKLTSMHDADRIQQLLIEEEPLLVSTKNDFDRAISYFEQMSEQNRNMQLWLDTIVMEQAALKDYIDNLEKRYAKNAYNARTQAKVLSTVSEIAIHILDGFRYGAIEDQTITIPDSVRQQIELQKAGTTVTYDSLVVQNKVIARGPGVKRWINRDQFRQIMEDTLTRMAYTGLLYQRLSNIKNNDDITPEGIAQVSSQLINTVYEIDNLRATLNYKKQLGKELNFQDYYPFIKTTVSFLNTIINEPLGNEPLGIQYKELGKFTNISDQSLALFENVFSKEYGQAIQNLVSIFSYIWEVDIEEARRDQGFLQDARNKIALGSEDKDEYELQIENYEKNKKKNRKVEKALITYGSFMAEVVAAKDAAGVKAALRTAAVPPGSSSVKRTSRFNISLNGYFGGGGYRESLSNDAISDEAQTGSSVGLSVPVGFTLSTGGFGLKNWSYSLFLPILDLGVVTAYRIDQDNAGLSSSLPDLTFSNVIAPGIYGVVNLPRSPFSIAAGFQLGPQNRSVVIDGAEIESGALRYGVTATIDVPIFNLFSR
ncbi:MAG: LysM peptidoglycan-binding domain-containing protein [Bacteroidota bacterium]